MNTIALYEDWIKKHSSLDYSSDSIDYRVNYMNVWGKLGINSNELLKEGCMAGFSLKEFKERFVSHLNESKDYDQILDTYSLYELNLLKTERSDWFKDDSKIVSIPNHSEAKVILFKNESLFIISTNTWRMINEGWLDDMIEKGKKIAGDVWDTLAKGAQEVYGFLAKLDSDIQKLTGMDIYATTAIAINILAAIIAFVPAFGQAAAPILTSIAGGIEVVGGMSKIKKGYEKISKVDDPIVKSMAAIGEGAPYLTVGAITIFFGLGDVISSIKSAAPGAAGIMASTKTAAKKLGDKMHHSMLGEAEKGFVKTVASLAKKKITSEGIVKNVSKAGAAIGLVFMVKGLKSILGGFADLVVESLGLVGKGIDFLLSIPSKISELIGKISSDNSSTVVKLIGNALKLAVKPITDAMSKFIDQGVKPIVSPLTEWLKKLPEQYKIAKEEIEKNLKGIPDTPVEIKKRDIKAKEVKISKEDKEKIQKLQKSGKKNESILPFEDWNSLGFV